MMTDLLVHSPDDHRALQGQVEARSQEPLSKSPIRVHGLKLLDQASLLFRSLAGS